MVSKFSNDTANGNFAKVLIAKQLHKNERLNDNRLKYIWRIWQ